MNKPAFWIGGAITLVLIAYAWAATFHLVPIP